MVDYFAWTDALTAASAPAVIPSSPVITPASERAATSDHHVELSTARADTATSRRH